GAAIQEGQAVDSGCAELSRRVIDLVTTGRLGEAEAAIDDALGNGAKRIQPVCEGLLLHNLATIMYLSGRFAEAEAFAERSVSTLEPILGPSTTGLLPPLQVLVGARLEQGKIGKSREALTKMQRIPLQRAEQRALVHGAAAVLSHSEGRFTESESEFRSALVEWERAGKSSGAEIASLLDGLASLYISEERLDEAARVLDGALAALTTAPEAVPMDRIRLLQVRAALDQRKGNWRQAERDLEQALALAGAELRPDADLQVSMMTDYARLLRNHHRRREARLVEQQVAALRGHSAMDNTVDVTELRRKSKFHSK
ncbi:MAG: tetratricopeptide repeat protein, partial [Bryobacteraceae bacterium]